MSLKKIISGGQTGADIAGIDAAIENGMLYGGWLPKGRKTENGPLDSRYTNMTEMPVGRYLERTERNVKDSDGTVIFTHGKVPGGWSLLNEYATKHNKPLLHLDLDIFSEPAAVETILNWIHQHDIQTLNVGGSQASKDEYIYDDVHSIIKNISKATEFLQNQQTPAVGNSSLHAPSFPAALSDAEFFLEPLGEVEASNATTIGQSSASLRNSQASSTTQPSQQVTPATTPPANKEGFTTELEDLILLEQSNGVESPPLIEGLPKTNQKKVLLYLSLGILIIAAAAMVLPGLLKSFSSPKITASTPGNSSEIKPALPPTTSLPEQPSDQDLPPSGPNTPAQPQPELLVENNAESKTEGRPLAGDKPEKQGREGENAQAISAPAEPLENNGAANGSLESLSDTSQETEKKQAPVKKPPVGNKSRCASLYKKMSIGRILDQEESDFLSQNCN